MRTLVIGFTLGYATKVFHSTQDDLTMIVAGVVMFFCAFMYFYFMRLDEKRKAMSEYERMMWNRQQKANQKTSMMMRGKWSDF